MMRGRFRAPSWLYSDDLLALLWEFKVYCAGKLFVRDHDDDGGVK